MKFIVKDYLKWVAEGQPNITKCFLTHPDLYKFCRSKEAATLETIAKEIRKELP
jgi:hypothetical protein